MLETTKNHRRALIQIKTALETINFHQVGILGVKNVVYGKLNGLDRAKMFKIVLGFVPAQTLHIHTQHFIEHAETSYGTFGIQTTLFY